jgi:hypothetical protein
MTNGIINFTISNKKTEFLDESKPLYYIEIVPDKKNRFQDFDYIIIKNFYTHTINIVQHSNNKWKCILGDYKLMTDSDCDEESEKFFVIHRKQLEDNGLSEDAKLMRIYLTQESPYWKEFDLQEIKFINEKKLSEDNETSFKYNMNNSRFEIGNFTILNDKEEINQKFIEIMKLNNSSDLKLNIFK